jgi:hypothetical protein
MINTRRNRALLTDLFAALGREGFSTGRSQPTCLVVEDDHTMLHLVVNYLGEHDIRVISASGRDERLACPRRAEPGDP